MATVIAPAVAFGDRTVTARYFGTGNASRTIWNLACMDSDRALLAPVIYRKDWQIPGHYRLYSTSRTNFAKYSEQVDNVAWTKTRILAFGSGSLANATVAPDGNTTADKLTEDSTASSTHEVVCSIVGTVSSGDTRTFSVYAKANGRTQLRLLLIAANGFSADFDLSAVTATNKAGQFGGTAASDATITAVGNGWYRCTVTGTFNAANVSTAYSGTIQFMTGGSVSYNGDGTSGLSLWGAQVESGLFATSYIVTTNTSASFTDYSTDANGKVTFAAAPVLAADVAYLDPWMGTACYKSFGTGDGTNTQFSLPWKPVAPSIYIDGVLQTLTTHYTVTPGGTVTFVTPPGNGTVLTWTGNMGVQR